MDNHPVATCINKYDVGSTSTTHQNAHMTLTRFEKTFYIFENADAHRMFEWYTCCGKQL